MKKRENYIVLPDVLYSMVFIIFIFYWVKKTKKIKFDSRDIYSTPSVYSIFISGFNSNTSEEEIR